MDLLPLSLSGFPSPPATKRNKRRSLKSVVEQAVQGIQLKKPKKSNYAFLYNAILHFCLGLAGHTRPPTKKIADVCAQLVEITVQHSYSKKRKIKVQNWI